MKLPGLKEAREEHGWSQKRLSDESGVSRDSISNYETGQRDAWPSTAKKLADALGVEIADLARPKAAAPPLLEWAMTAPEKEYDGWVKAASSTDLHKVWIELSRIAESMEIGAEHAVYRDRIQKAADQFLRLQGISDWEVRPRREANREGREVG